jgi:hypothetical protein
MPYSSSRFFFDFSSNLWHDRRVNSDVDKSSFFFNFNQFYGRRLTIPVFLLLKPSDLFRSTITKKLFSKSDSFKKSENSPNFELKNNIFQS